jgi:predicted secreted hydrolase
VDGIAWFDHQWGDFVSVGAGGWDWFAVNLDDGTDLTISIVRDEHAHEVFRYGTLVGPSGKVVQMARENFSVADGFAFWDSPLSGRSYAISRSIVLDGGTTVIDLTATLREQELDTRATTGVIYWEGSQTVRVISVDERGNSSPIGGGEAYVEITRYDEPPG